ncbi:ornithine cyclodeaminase [Streptomyces corynorhini]|uniref:ornithine cyclodeaminase n=1 Tax=Streptomyces corynorhini TaxID=2282652 RepID=UPI00131405D5|nr:ornithine cyclodeaminase [Streptomyces corynorhini]
MTEDLLFLDRAAVMACAADVDLCEATAWALGHHAEGATRMPAEGYLPWTNDAGGQCRSLAMLGAVEPPGGTPVRGVKIINAATTNPALGAERAGGVSLLFDQHTARPVLMAEAGWLSAARTAAYTMVSLRHLGPREWDALSVIGCGTLARAHLELLGTQFPQAKSVHLYDTDPERAADLAKWLGQHCPQLHPQIAPSARAAVGAARVVVTTTTVDTGFVPAAWLEPGTFVAHVSLSDLLPDAFVTAEAIYVDDVDLVAENPRRTLGALLRDGLVAAPGVTPRRGDATGEGAAVPEVNGTLGQVIAGRIEAVRPHRGHVISNPFGMAILDVALLEAVHQAALRRGTGQRLCLY